MTIRLNFLRVLVAGGMLASSLTLGSGPAHGQEIKQMMGENFQNVQRILTNLVTSNYASVPGDVGKIRDHADQLMKSPPAMVKSQEDKEMFLVYAGAVKNAANNLIAVSQEVIRRDAQGATTGELKVDYLRVSAAQYFGIMVSSCVLCHNQFRRHVVKVK